MKLRLATIHTKNLGAALAFYTELLGLEEVRRFSPGPGFTLVFLSDGSGGIVELIENQNAPAPSPGEALSVGFTVDDMEAVHSRAKAMGVTILRGPDAMPSGVTLLFVKDPDGVTIEFLQGFDL